MLILGRNVNESIQVGPVKITFVGFHGGNQIKIGIDAPSNMPIRRSELPARCTCVSHGTCELHTGRRAPAR